jgi:hypothetical protein
MLCIAGLSSIDTVFLLIIIFDERKVDAAEAIGTIIAGKLRPGFSKQKGKKLQRRQLK